MSTYEVLKDIEAKLGLEYKHKYMIEPFDRKSSTARFVLIYKPNFLSNGKALLASNSLDESNENVQGIEVTMEYLNDLPKYKGKLKVHLQKWRLLSDYWTLYWVDYWTNIEGQESKIKELINQSELSKEDKSELYHMMTGGEHRVLAGYIPGDRQNAQSIMEDISAGAFRELTQNEEDALRSFVKNAMGEMNNKDKSTR